MLAAIGAGAQMLAAILDPAHRMAAAHRQPRQADFLGQQNALVAETAADIGRDDADVAVIEPETSRQAGAVDVRHLRRAVDGELLEPAAPCRHHAAPFQRRHRLPRGADLAGDLDRRVEAPFRCSHRRRFRGKRCRPSARAPAPSLCSRACSMSCTAGNSSRSSSTEAAISSASARVARDAHRDRVRRPGAPCRWRAPAARKS